MKRGLKRAGKALLILLGSIILLLGVGIGLLLSPFGSEKVRSFAESKVNETLKGSVEFGSLDLRTNGLHLTDVVLYDPDGDLVASIEVVDVEWKLAALAKKTLHLRHAALLRPKLFIEQDEEGTNLQRALEPREPAEPDAAQDDSQSAFSLIVDDFSIREGSLSYEQEQEEGLTVALDDLEIDSSLRALRGGERLEVKLSGNAGLEEPLSGPVALELTAEGRGDQRSGKLEASVAGAQLALTGVAVGAEEVRVELLELEIPPRVARAFAPEFPLQVPVQARGEAMMKGSAASIDLDGEIGTATFELVASGDLETPRVDALTLELDGANFAQWLEDGPESDVDLRVEAEGAGRDLDTLTGSLMLEVPPSQLSGATLGPVSIRARADRGTFFLEEGIVEAPGVSLRASGEGSAERVQASATLDATNLGLFGQTVGALVGGLPLEGRGTMKLEANGPIEAPMIRAEGNFPVLGYEENRIEGLRFTARADRPIELDGVKLELAMQRATLGTTALRDTELSLSAENDRVQLAARTGGEIVASVSASALVEEDRKGARIDALTLRYPEATWKLLPPARIRADGERLLVEDFRIESGSQKLAVSLDKNGARVDGSLQLQALDLAKLPAFLFEEPLELEGLAHASLEASGTVEKPTVEGEVRLEEVRYQNLDGIGLAVRGRFSPEHARGKLDATAGPARVNGTFNLPIDALIAGRRERVSANLAFHEVNLAEVREAFELDEPIAGTVRGSLEVSGYANDPKLQLTFEANQLMHPKLPASDLKLVAQSDEETRKLGARLDLTTLGRTSFVEVRLPWTLGRLVRKTPTASQAMRAPIRLEAKLDAFPLPLLYTSDTMPKLVLGTLSAEVNLRGSALDPRGEATLKLEGLTTGDEPPLNLALQAAAKPKRVVATLEGSQSDQKVLALTATLERGLAGLRSTAAVQRLPFALEGKFGPLNIDGLQNLLGETEDAWGEAYPRLRGALAGSLRGSGTLGRPSLNADVSIKGLGSAQSDASGDVALKWEHRGGQNLVDVKVRSATPGELTLAARIPYPLGYRPNAEAPELSSLPLDVQLEANALELEFLSGLHPKLLGIGGPVTGKIEAKGTVATPEVNGRMEWKDGNLTVAGSGEYRDVHVLVSGTQNRIALEDLSARAGKGSLSLKLLAERSGQAWRLTGEGDLREFPLINESQLVATVTLRSEAEGSATAELIDFGSVRIDEAQIVLPATERKDLQELDAPERVLFVRNGEPIEGQEELLAAWNGTGEEGSATGGSGSAAGEDGAGPPAPGGSADGPVLRAQIVAPRNIWLRGEDLNIEVGLEEGFRVEVDEEPIVFGTVYVLRGRIEVFSRRFDVERDSTVQFTGPVMTPMLDVTAIHENEREDVVVTLHVTGQGEDLEVQPTSEPALSETEIYTLLATGRRSLEPGSGGASTGGSTASSVIGSLAAGQLKKVLGEALPLDVFTLEAGDDGLSGTKVEAGSYVGDRLYIGFTTQLGADPLRDENQNAVQLEYQLGKRWSLDAQYGDARQGYLDLIWSKDY